MYRTVAQLDQLTNLLAQFFPQLCSRFTLPEPSVQGRAVHAIRLRAGSGPERRGVLLIGGTHSRELMNPDLLVELAVHLIVSCRNGTDVVLGNRTWSATDIKIMMETLDIYIVPCINPDGRIFVMTVDDMWRKNRRDNPGTPCDGVDLNRNLDLLWGVTEGQTSCSPCSDVYAGPSAFSEPETRNVRHLLDTRRIDVFADVHSYSELVLYPWGHAPTQTTDPGMRFTTLPTGNCQPIADPNYEEYMLPRDLTRFRTVAQRVVTAIADVRGRTYTPQSGIALYPTTGTHSDYVYSRHIANANVRKTYGFTLETGPFVGNAPDSFHPDDPEPIKREAESGLLALIQQSICAIELIGLQFLGHDDEIDALRRVRDDVLSTTPTGREWIALFERVQTPLLRAVLADKRLAREAADLIALTGELLADDRKVIDRDVVAKAEAMLSTLDESMPGERDELGKVRARLKKVTDRRVVDAIDAVLASGPGDPA
jgi:murein tripeptide amidase MpaA